MTVAPCGYCALSAGVFSVIVGGVVSMATMRVVVHVVLGGGC
jgi:hypothetical protein